MDSFNHWEEAGISAVIQTSSPNKNLMSMPNDNFDQYFTDEYNDDIDNLFNETLTGLQELDVPSGFITEQMNDEPRKQTRKVSGTAIFGFADHNREISIGSLTGDLYRQLKPTQDYTKSISPGEILKGMHNAQQEDQAQSQQHHLHHQQQSIEHLGHLQNLQQDAGLAPPPDIDYDNKILLLEEDEFEVNQDLGNIAQSSPIKKQTDFSNNHPKSYRFPPSPSPSRYTSRSNPGSVMRNGMQNGFNNSYSVKYLQDLNSSLKDPIDYVDDIEPLLEQPLDQNLPLQISLQQVQQPQNLQHIQSSPPPQERQSSFSTPFKYVPIPVQEPTYKKDKLQPDQQFQQLQQQMQHIQHQQQIQIQQNQNHNLNPNQSPTHQIQQHQQQRQENQFTQQMQMQQQSNTKLSNTMRRNTFLPPPSPPTLSNGSPEWQSSPEPASPSPSRESPNKFSSPVHPQLRNNNVNFHTPHFFSEADQINNFFSDSNVPSQQRNPNQNQFQQNTQIYQQQIQHLHSSPVQSLKSLNSSPVKYYASPLRNTQPSNDDTVDMNNSTIAQLTPLKNNLPNTPIKSQIQLEWSPIISPNAKASRDVKRHIKESSARRRIKKTSLLPPGELDQYWVGPDHEKVYTCTYKDCDKKFTRRYNVRSHIQTHLSDRPFGCPHCPKRFVRQHDLNRHVKGHLETTHCKCLCGKEFTRIDALKKHQLRNICVGGMMQPLVSNGISKPHRKSRSPELDEFTSNKLNDELINCAAIS